MYMKKHVAEFLVAKINISFPSISIPITFSGSYCTYLHKNVLIYGNGEMIDMVRPKEAKRKEAQRFASQRPLHCARFLELNCVQKAACFSTVVFTFE